MAIVVENPTRAKEELVNAAFKLATRIGRDVQDANTQLNGGQQEVQTVDGRRDGITRLWRRGLSIAARMFETVRASDSTFGQLRNNILEMGALLAELRIHFEKEQVLKRQLEYLMDAIEHPVDQESRAAALQQIMTLVASQADSILGPNVFEHAPETITAEDVERRWLQIKQVLPVIIVGIDAELTIVRAFDRVYQDARLLYPLLHKARESAMTAAKLSRLTADTTGLQVTTFNLTVGNIDAALALTEQAMEVYGQLSDLLEMNNPKNGVTNDQYIAQISQRTQALQDFLSDGIVVDVETPQIEAQPTL